MLLINLFQTAGYFLGYVFYMALESYNILTLSDFLYFWGIVFMVATTLVAIFKHEDQRKEKDEESSDEDDGDEILGVVDTYKQLVSSCCDPSYWPLTRKKMYLFTFLNRRGLFTYFCLCTVY